MTRRTSLVDERRILTAMLGRSVVLALFLAAYAWLLWVTYSGTIAPTFGYLGEVARPPDPAVFFLAFVATWMVGLALPRTLDSAGDFILWVLYVLTIVPAMLVPHLTGICTTPQAILLTVAGATSYPLIMLIVRRGPRAITPVSPLSPLSFWIVLGVLAGICYALLFNLVSIQIAVPSLTDVYDLRSSYRLLVGSAGPIVGYLVRFLGNVINPILICRGLYGGPKVLIPIGLFGQLVIFSVTGFKLTLLSGVGILAVAGFFLLNRNRNSMHVLTAGVALVLASNLVDELTGSITVSTVFVYRLILTAGTLPAAYASFFESNPNFAWSDSFLSAFGQPIYPRSMAFTVGEFHTGSPLVTVNSHYLADGYGNFGLRGIFLEALVLGLLLLATVSAARGLPVPMVAGVLITPLMSLANSSPFTAVLSSGFILLIPLLLLMPRTGASDMDGGRGRRAGQGRPRKRSFATSKLAGSPLSGPVRRPDRLSR